MADVNGTKRYSRGVRRMVYGVGGGLWLTGGVWLLFHYFVRESSAFGDAHHPAEHWVLALHGLFGFLTVAMFGYLWAGHIGRGWQKQKRRLTGGLLVAALGCLTISGYLLYYLNDDSAQQVTALFHWGLGLLLPAAVVAHRLKRKPKTESETGYADECESAPEYADAA